MYEHLHTVSPGNGVSAHWLRLIRCFARPGLGQQQPWIWLGRWN